MFGAGGDSLTPASSRGNLNNDNFFSKQRRATCTILNSTSTISSIKTSLKTRNSNCFCNSKRREALGYNYCCLGQDQPNTSQRLLPELPPRSSSASSSTNIIKLNLSKTGQRSSSHYYLPPAGLTSNEHQNGGTGSLLLLSPNTHKRYLTASGGVFKFGNGVNSDCNNESFDNDRVRYKLFLTFLLNVYIF